MRILAIGDFHGKFQKKWVDLIKKENIDLVVSNGDYFPFLYRKLWFKHCYNTDVEFWEVIGKKKYKEITLREISAGDKVFEKLNNLAVPVITVLGNYEQAKSQKDFDVSDVKRPRGKAYWSWAWQDFLNPLLSKYKNIKRFDYSYYRFGDFVFIGMNGGSFPGNVKSKAYKKHRKILERLFRKFSKENKEKRVIFVSHNVPYNTRLDKITDKDAHKKAKGKHYGSKLVRRIIDKYQPILHLAGHIDEGVGKQKLGKTLAINCGPAHHGKAAIIEINDKGKVKVKFIK
ncbi:MAG: metallophosphoesterase [Nanoarchaeota archaeon]|nr:metallophosphoesterase [Nanoarchaeota archaeon]